MSSLSGRTAARARTVALALALISLLVALAIGGATVARADETGNGTFAIYTCQSAGGVQDAFANPTPSVGMGSWSDCAPSGRDGGIKVHAGVGPGAVGAFANAQATMSAADGTHFGGAVMSYDAYADTTSKWNAWLAASNDGSFSGNSWNGTTRRWLDGCTADSFCPGMSASNKYFNIDGARAVQLMAVCGSLSCPTNSTGVSPYSRAFVYLKGAQFSLVDEWDPVVTGLTHDDSWHRGPVTFPWTGEDTTGVKRAYALVDGGISWSADYAGDCSYTRPVPCVRGRSDAARVDAPIADGQHSLQMRLDDAAGRHGYSDTVYFKTDNTAPDRPSSASADGGEGWLTTRTRTVRFVVPDQGAGAPITGQHVKMCNEDTGACSEWDANPVYAAKVPVVTPDDPADYTVRVALWDAAGNLGAYSDPVHLRYDNRAPGDADPRNANGWLNAVERASYQQHIQLVDGGVIPRSQIRGYSITRDGSTPDASVDATGHPVDIPISDLPEGINTVKARAVSNAGVPSPNVRTATVPVDLTAPTTSVDGVPEPQRWMSSAVALTVHGSDQLGLSGMTPADSTEPLEKGAYVAYKVDAGNEQKVRGSTATATVSDDGEHTISYYAVDVAGNKSDPQTVRVKIDRTAPTAAATTNVPANSWQRESVTVSISGDDGVGHSGMDGGRLVFRLNNGEVQTADGPSTSFKVDDDGEHVVSYYAVDAAGNESQHSEMRFRIDKSAPSPVVIERQGSDKRKIEVSADDLPSGVAEVQVGIRRVGGLPEAQSLRKLAKKDPARYRRTKLKGTRTRRRINTLGEDWVMLPATLDNGRWVATIPNDRSLRRGTYQLEAVAQDQPGNESATDKFRGGAPGLIVIAPPPQGGQPDCCLPEQSGDQGFHVPDTSSISSGTSSSAAGEGTVDTKLTAGVVKKVLIKPTGKCRKPKTAALKKRCKKKRKYREVLQTKSPVPFGKKAAIKGKLTTKSGAPIAGAVIDVASTPSAIGFSAKAEGAIRTDKNGAFTYTAKAGSSRAFAFRFGPQGDYRRADAQVNLLVPASAILKSDKRQVTNGQSVKFTGRLLGKPLPSKGKVIDLQVFYRGKWRTFGTPRANKKGAFKFTYRFEATRVTTTYKFRARLRAESAYPYQLGYSKNVSVRVRGH